MENIFLEQDEYYTNLPKTSFRTGIISYHV